MSLPRRMLIWLYLKSIVEEQQDLLLAQGSVSEENPLPSADDIIDNRYPKDFLTGFEQS
jgi:hypothetical protein